MIGTTIGSYHILETIGKQAIATTYKARDLKLDRLVMVKAVDIPDQDSDALRSFKKEARASAVLNHPNIATIFDVLDSDDGRFLVYEYLPGSTLAERIARGAASGDLIPVDRALEYIMDVARGLAEAHRHGIVHRDLTAESVIVTPTHVVKITNFGKARLSGAPTFSGSLGLTSAFGFIAPERLQGKNVDHRGDIYSLSSLLFEVLTGEKPYKAQGAAAMLQEVLYNPVPDMASLRPEIQVSIQRIVDKGMAKDPADRYQSMESMLDDLTAVLRSGSVEEELPADPAIAILPFQTIGATAELEAFAQGVVEEIVFRLQALDGLQVASSTSAARFKGSTDDLRRIGAHLGANLILEGNLRSAGPKMRLILKLTAADTGYQIWSQRLEREMSEPFTLQDEIAELAETQMRAFLGGEELETVKPSITADSPASGQFLAATERPAPAKEPEPQEAAEVNLLKVLDAASGIAAPKDVLPVARSVAGRILAVGGETSGARFEDALIAQGYAETILEGPGADAESSFRRALAANPSRMEALTGLAKFILAAQGRFSDANGVLDQADPKALPAVLAKGWILFWQRRYGDALQQSRAALKLDPQAPEVYLLLGRSCAAMGQLKEAVVALGRGRLVDPHDPRLLAALSYCHGKSGQSDEANRLADELGALARKSYVSVLDLALPYAGLGLSEWVECCLDKAATERPVGRLWFEFEPEWDGYRKVPAA